MNIYVRGSRRSGKSTNEYEEYLKTIARERNKQQKKVLKDIKKEKKISQKTVKNNNRSIWTIIKNIFK